MRVFTLLIAFIAIIPVVVQAEEMKTHQYSVEPGFVRIVQENETLFIDYENFSLFRFNFGTNNCAYFSLLDSQQTETKNGHNTGFIEEKSKMFAEVLLRAGTEEQVVVEEGYSLKNLIFAPKAMSLLTVQTPRLHIYGQTFYPEFVGFLVQNNHDLFAQLKEIAEYNEPFYNKNPLLRRIDVLGLLEILGGVPVKKMNKESEVKIRFTLSPTGTLRNKMPAMCVARP